MPNSAIQSLAVNLRGKQIGIASDGDRKEQGQGEANEDPQKKGRKIIRDRTMKQEKEKGKSQKKREKERMPADSGSFRQRLNGLWLGRAPVTKVKLLRPLLISAQIPRRVSGGLGRLSMRVSPMGFVRLGSFTRLDLSSGYF